MGLLFNSLLNEIEIDPVDARLLRHETKKEGGSTPYTLWRHDLAAFERYQSSQKTRNRTKFQGRYWASFVAPTPGATMFVGLYEVSLQGVDPADLAYDLYNCRRVPLLDGQGLEYGGRLFVHWGDSSSSKRAWVQRAHRMNKEIVELKRMFQEEVFPGATEFARPLSKLETMPPGWQSILSHSKGVYMLACPRTHELYVGSACGLDGFLGRWRQYAKDGHGGNVGLRGREPSDYVVSILEIAGSRISNEEILKLESTWKRRLWSADLGLNRNGAQSAFVIRSSSAVTESTVDNPNA